MARKAKPAPVRVAIIARTKDEGETYAAHRGVAVEDAVILTARAKDAARGYAVGRILVTPGMRTDPNRPALMAAARAASAPVAVPAPVPASPRPLASATVDTDEDDDEDATLDFEDEDE